MLPYGLQAETSSFRLSAMPDNAGGGRPWSGRDARGDGDPARCRAARPQRRVMTLAFATALQVPLQLAFT